MILVILFVIVVASVAQLLCKAGGSEDPVTETVLGAALLPWMIIHDLLECAIFILASVLGYSTLSYGLYWEVWALYVMWIMSCNMAETVCMGPPSLLAIISSVLPGFSARVDIGKDKVVVCLCFVCSGALGILLGVIGILSILCPRVLLMRSGYECELARLYFVKEPRKTVKTRSLTGC